MLAKHLADHSPDDLFVRLTAFTGLRAGEMLGLQARDVNLHRRTLDVRRTYQYTRAGWVEATPKSDNSARTVVASRRVVWFPACERCFVDVKSHRGMVSE